MSILSLFAQSDYDYPTDSSLYDSSYYSTTNNLTPEQAAAATAFGVGFLIFMLIFIAAAYVISAFLLGRIFKKAGEEQWKAWVPIYNLWVFMELGEQKGFWAVLMLLPFVNIIAVIFSFIAAYHIGLKLQKSGAFVLLYIFIPIVWLIWLAFDKSTWQGAHVAAQPGAPAGPAPQPPVPPTSQQTPPTPPTPPAA